ncbi:trypsin-like peptidase domain-containing protein [Gammaproteobacteria bacterium]|nr:trypsin-like peptidase domain-containing protein [Gammaproteobacteria bacterium]
MHVWIALLLVFCAIPKSWPVADIELADSATVIVVTYDKAGSFLGFGSGFFVTNEGHLLTNHHVVENSEIHKIAITGKAFSKEAVEARLVWAVPEYDLAVLKTLKSQGVTPLKILSTNVEKGAQIWALGYPGKQLENMDTFGESFENMDATLTTGIVSRVFQGVVAEGTTKYPLIQHTAEISQGNSGGPLLDECGSVVGINTGITFSAMEEVNDTDFFAVGSRGILGLLKIRIPGIVEANGCAAEEPSVPQSETEQNPAANNSQTETTNPKHEGGEVIGSSTHLDKNLIRFLFVFLFLGLAFFFYFRKRNGGARADRIGARDGSSSALESDRREERGLVRMSGFNDKGAPVSFAFETSASPEEQLWIIGRSVAFSDYQIESQGVSRAHLQLKALGTDILVRDLGSTNGTILNGKKLAPFRYHKLSVGDEINVATCTLAITN